MDGHDRFPVLLDITTRQFHALQQSSEMHEVRWLILSLCAQRMIVMENAHMH